MFCWCEAQEDTILPKPHAPNYLSQLVANKEVIPADLAAAAAVPLPRLARIIKGSRRPRAAEAARLARQIGMPVTLVFPLGVRRRK